MTFEEMMTGFQRLAGVLGRPWDEGERERRKAYCDEVFRKFGWVMAGEWEKAVTWIIDHQKTRTLPTLVNYSQAIDALRKSGSIKEFTKAKCATCGGTKMVYGRFRHQETDEILDAVKPCHSCNPQDWPHKEELIPVIEPDPEAVRMAKALTPDQARYSLALGERQRVKWHSDVLMVLMEKSCQDKKPVNEKPKEVNPVFEAVLQAVNPNVKPEEDGLPPF